MILCENVSTISCNASIDMLITIQSSQRIHEKYYANITSIISSARDFRIVIVILKFRKALSRV